MKVLAPGLLAIAASLSVSVAATVQRPVPLPSKSCCDNCTVARYVPPSVPSVPATMVHGAAVLEAFALFGVVALALLSRGNRRPPQAPPEPASGPARLLRA